MENNKQDKNLFNGKTWIIAVIMNLGFIAIIVLGNILIAQLTKFMIKDTNIQFNSETAIIMIGAIGGFNTIMFSLMINANLKLAGKEELKGKS